ncbi:MAG: hypothetical protein AAF950_10660 [Pseudomonadota bacterium]
MRRIAASTAILILASACGDSADTTNDALTGVDDVVEFKAGGPQADSNVTSEIDWQASRAALSGTSRDAAGSVQIESAGANPPVPVLLPTGIVVPQSRGAGPVYRPTSDGYFATYPGSKYDIVVNGTNQIATVGGEPVTRDETMVFTQTVAGAQVSLSRFGADYLIEFECNEIQAGSETCIDEAEALSVAEKLVVVGSR